VAILFRLAPAFRNDLKFNDPVPETKNRESLPAPGVFFSFGQKIAVSAAIEAIFADAVMP
jgi:hypothetical protein